MRSVLLLRVSYRKYSRTLLNFNTFGGTLSRVIVEPIQAISFLKSSESRIIADDTDCADFLGLLPSSLRVHRDKSLFHKRNSRNFMEDMALARQTKRFDISFQI